MAQLRTDPTRLLLAIQAQLVSDGVFPVEASKISLRMNPPLMALQADSYAITLPLTQTANRAAVAGGGRASLILVGRFNVYVRNRNSLDVAYEAESWLTAQEGGLLPQLVSVIDSLEMTLLDGMVEPCRLVFFGEPHQRYQSPEWGDVVIEYEFSYLLDIEQTGD